MSDCCLTLSWQFLSYFMERTNYFWWSWWWWCQLCTRLTCWVG